MIWFQIRFLHYAAVVPSYAIVAEFDGEPLVSFWLLIKDVNV
jgi:hypothetical protein